jgi:hypothetical protein
MDRYEPERMSEAMKIQRVWAFVLLSLVVVTGCQSSVPRRRPGALASNEPGLDPAPGTGPGTSIVEAPTARPRSLSFVDRHPIFSRPRDLYESSGDNVIVKGAAATVVGIPAGVFGEMKQIVVGRQPDSPGAY